MHLDNEFAFAVAHEFLLDVSIENLFLLRNALLSKPFYGVELTFS